MDNLFAIYRSPVGYLRIEQRGGRLVRLQILEPAALEQLCSEAGSEVDQAAGLKAGSEVGLKVGLKAGVDPFCDMVYGQICQYLEGRRTRFDIELDLEGRSSFERAVLEELLTIPYGQKRSYGAIAAAIGAPKAARAVGGAANRNPIQIVVPCHRVIGAAGQMVGYAAGIALKQRLLAIEQRAQLQLDLHFDDNI